jgi:hypothetical protein
MLDAKPCSSDPFVSDPNQPDKEANGSEFENLLRCASEMLRGGAKVAPSGVETKNPQVQG